VAAVVTQIVWILFLIEIVLPVIHLVTECIVWVSRPRRFFTQIHMYAHLIFQLLGRNLARLGRQGPGCDQIHETAPLRRKRHA